MIKAVFQVTLPDELLQPFMQMVRDFDMKHDPDHEGKVHFEILTDSNWPAEKMVEVMNAISPRPAHMYFEKFDEGDA
jgi:hypothetical protein